MASNSKFVQSTIARGPHDWRRQIHRGWVDAQNRNTWPRDYETMSVREQIAYEQGRMLTREAMAEGFALPVWRGDKAGCAPVDKLWADVCQKLGRCIVPATWEPPAALLDAQP